MRHLTVMAPIAIACVLGGCGSSLDTAPTASPKPRSPSAVSTTAATTPITEDPGATNTASPFPLTIEVSDDAPASARQVIAPLQKAYLAIDAERVTRVVVERTPPGTGDAEDAGTDAELWLNVYVELPENTDGGEWTRAKWDAARLIAYTVANSYADHTPAPMGLTVTAHVTADGSVLHGDNRVVSLLLQDTSADAPTRSNAAITESAAAAGFKIDELQRIGDDRALVVRVQAPTTDPQAAINLWAKAFDAVIGTEVDRPWFITLETSNGQWVKKLAQEPLTAIRQGVSLDGLDDPGVMLG